MKRFLAVLITVLLMLSLCSCGSAEEAKLYQKYAHIIDRLEMEDYNGAIQEITTIANSGREQEDYTPPETLLYDEWHRRTNNGDANAPSSISISSNGTAVVDGRQMSLLVEYSDEFHLAAFLLENGAQIYRVEINSSSQYSTPWLMLQEVETRGDSMTYNWMGEYVNDPMLNYLLSDWYKLDIAESMPENMWFSVDSASFHDSQSNWTLLDSSDGTISVDLNGTYTATLELRDERPILYLTDSATGLVGTYYSYQWDYDKSWPEYIYPCAMDYLNECVEELANGKTVGFWNRLEEDGADYRGNAAWKKLYEIFTELGDYKESAEIVSRFTILEGMYTGSQIQRVDNLGNQTEETYESFQYNVLGQMTRGKSYNILRMYRTNNPYFFYDEAGQITKIQVGSGDSISTVITPAYDDQGRMISAVAQYNSGSFDFSYSYNEAGRLAEHVTYSENYRYQYSYSYDDAGLLTQVVCRYGWATSSRESDDRDTYTYSYDAQGHLIGCVTTVEDRYSNEYHLQSITTTAYTNDESGRPISASITVESDTNKYASQTVFYTYEDLYFFE